MTSWVCIDANVVLKLVLNEEYSEQADALGSDFKSQTAACSILPIRTNFHSGCLSAACLTASMSNQ